MTLGCGGQSDPVIPECDVPTLFAERCSGDTLCHSGDTPAAYLDLLTPGMGDRVSNLPGVSCQGILADPARPEDSIIYDKIANNPPTCGGPMPATGPLLTADEVVCVRDWISGLLPPQPQLPDAGPDCPECVCEPSSVASCYTGPDGTIGVGQCVGGNATCSADGLSLGPCEGEIRPTGENCFTEDVDENCDGATPPCTELWSRSFGGLESQSYRATAVADNGDIFALGDFVGTVNFGGDDLQASGLKADLVLARYDHFGNHVWSKRFGDSSNQYAGALTVDSTGAVILAGTFGATVDFGSGPFIAGGTRDAFVLKLAGDTGTHLFSVQLGGTGDDYGFGVGVFSDDDIVVTGRFEDTIDIGGTVLTSAGERDIYVARLSPLGVPVWAQRHGGDGPDMVFDAAVDRANDDIVLFGLASGTIEFGGAALTSAGARDLFVARLDGNGDHQWSSLHGDAADQLESTIDEKNMWMDVALGSAGEVYLAAPFSGTVSFGGVELTSAGKVDVLLVKLNSAGELMSGNRYGGGGTELPLGLAVDSDGYAVMVGRFFSSGIDFGASGQILGGDSSECFLARFLP